MDNSFLLQRHWGKFGVKAHHGIACPLSSLYTADSCGIGEILDLVPFISWLGRLGASLLQLLPINDSGADPSPYMALSAYAINPIYLSLHALPAISETPGYLETHRQLQEMKLHRRVLYHDVLEKKLTFLQNYAQTEVAAAILQSPEFAAFQEKESYWLLPYALFRSLKQQYSGKAWWHFSSHSRRPKDIKGFLKENPSLKDTISFWMLLQYLLFDQWTSVRRISEASRVRIIGDVPILVNKDSADVWWNPNLFDCSVGVGAPPDMYAQDGQSWGFPSYQWNNVLHHRHTWFTDRLKLQSQLYDAYRIDHVVGLFRLWIIPEGKPARSGSFSPKLSEEWTALGEELLTMMAKTTNMLPIGEDLGDIPDSVRTSLQRLGIPGMKVLRWCRNWRAPESQKPFLDPKRFSPESLITLSTHDSSTLAGWWKEDPAAAKKFSSDMGIAWDHSLSFETRSKILTLCHNSSSLLRVNLFQEYLALFQDLSWHDATFDRINIPGTISSMNWTWKTRRPLEKILQHEGLHQKLSQLFAHV